MWTLPELRGTPMTLAIQAAMVKGAMDSRAKRVYWVVDIKNTRQMALVEKKIGAQKEGVLRNLARINDGRWCDSAVFSLVGDEMRQAVARIEAQLEIDFSKSD
jgi:RimJ/RimL family protein N-acetyltransferase